MGLVIRIVVGGSEIIVRSPFPLVVSLLTVALVLLIALVLLAVAGNPGVVAAPGVSAVRAAGCVVSQVSAQVTCM